MRNMSFFYTTDQMLAELKWITRRVGWWFLESGDLVMAVKKGMGLKKDEKIQRLYPIQIITATPEPLSRLLVADQYAYDEVLKEGFPDMSPKQFVEFFCDSHKCNSDKVVNRIHFRRFQ